MLSTYDLTAILDLPLYSAFSLIKRALEKEKEEAAWDIWANLYPFMIMGWIEFKSFNDFHKEALDPVLKLSDKSLDEIEIEMIAVIEKYENKKGSVTTSKI